MGRALSPDDLARRLGISRAALYRAEKGEIAKIEMLTAIADELHVSLPSLLGVGIEYVDNATSFFERMRQTEEGCDQIIGLFSPISYLVTTDGYDVALAEALEEAGDPVQAGEVTRILDILRQRKAQFARRRPLLVSIISDADIARFLSEGLVSRVDLDPAVVERRRRMALREARHISRMLREPDIGVQLGVACEPFPATSFEIVRRGGEAVLAVSPFRLGHNPNIRVGAGLITSAPEALELHRDITRRLWTSALKGHEAAAHVDTLIDRHGIS